MAITLKAAIDNSEVKSGLQEIRTETAKTAAATTQAAEATDDSKKASQEAGDAAVDALQEQLNRVKKLQGEVKELGDQYEKAGDEAKQAGDSMGSAGRTGSSGVSRTAVAVTGLNQAFELLKDGIDLASGALTAMHENGNESAGDLLKTFSGFKEQLLEIGNDPRIANMLGGTNSVLKDWGTAAIEGVKEASLQASQYIQNSYADVFTYLGESFGVLEDGSYALLQASQERFAIEVENSKALAEQRKKEAEQQKIEAEQIKLITEELAKIEKEKAAASKKSTLDEIESTKQLQDLIDDSKELLNDKETVKTKEKIVDLLDTIAQAERRIADVKKKEREAEKQAAKDREAEAKTAAAKAAEEHKKALERIAEREKAEIESRQRILAAEAEMLQGINRLRDQQDKQKEGAFAGPVGGLIAGANAAKNDQQAVFRDFVKERVRQAEEAAAAAIDQAQARAEEEARKSGADPEGVKEYGREARRKAIAENRGAGAKARAQAAEDWRGYQAGKGTEEERAGISNEIEGARERVGNAYLEQKKKELEREARRSGGRMTSDEKALIDEVFRIVQQVMHSTAVKGDDLSALQEQVKALQKMLEALTRADDERRRRNGGRP